MSRLITCHAVIATLPAERVVVLGLVDDAEVLERLLELVNVREAVDRLVAGGVRALYIRQNSSEDWVSQNTWCPRDQTTSHPTQILAYSLRS